MFPAMYALVFQAVNFIFFYLLLFYNHEIYYSWCCLVTFVIFTFKPSFLAGGECLPSFLSLPLKTHTHFKEMIT